MSNSLSEVALDGGGIVDTLDLQESVVGVLGVVSSKVLSDIFPKVEKFLGC